MKKQWTQWETLYFWTPKSLQMVIAAMKIKRCLLLWRKVMTNLDSILKSRDITLLTKVRLVKAVFPVVMYGCESWTVKKAECRRIDAFELWCWRRLLRVPWTDGHESEWAPGVGDGQGGLACCNSWGCKESDTTERLNWTELNWAAICHWENKVNSREGMDTHNIHCCVRSKIKSQCYALMLYWHLEKPRELQWPNCKFNGPSPAPVDNVSQTNSPLYQRDQAHLLLTPK